MKCLRLRIALLTFVLGIVSVSFSNAEYERWTAIQVDVPKVESASPIIIRICPESTLTDEEKAEFYKKYGVPYYPQSKEINCNLSGGGGAGGGGGSGGQTCEEFIKSLGKLTKQSRRILAYTPCRDSISK